MDVPGWTELKELISRITALTGNVSALQRQMDRALTQIERLQAEVSDLKADLRVAKAENEAQAVKAATSTIIQAHERILDRMHAIETEMEGLRAAGAPNNPRIAPAPEDR